MSESKKEIIRTIKFTVIAASAGVVQFGSFALMEELLHWAHWVSYLVSLVLSVIWNFTLNRKYTFHSANNVPVAMLKVALFYVVFTPVSTYLGNYLVETLGWNEFLVTILNMIINLITEYLYQRWFVFGKTIDTNDKAKETNNENEKI